MERYCFPFQAGLKPVEGGDLKFEYMIRTGDQAGTIEFQQIQESMGNPTQLELNEGLPEGNPFVLAARIQGSPEVKQDNSAAKEEKKKADEVEKGAAEKKETSEESKENQKAESEKKKPIDVIYVADIDVLGSPFFSIRNQADPELDWRFDNVAFVLNVVDSLAEDSRFLEIRKRKTRLSTLKVVESKIDEARSQERIEAEKYEKEYKDAEKKAEEKLRESAKALQEEIAKMQDPSRKEKTDPANLQRLLQEFSVQQRVAERRIGIVREGLQRKREKRTQEIRRQKDLEILNIQNKYKWMAVVFPPIPPLLIGLGVFVTRRLREREGISKARLRY